MIIKGILQLKHTNEIQVSDGETFIDAKKTMIRIIDSTRSTGKVSQRDLEVEYLFSQGYKIFRKR